MPTWKIPESRLLFSLSNEGRPSLSLGNLMVAHVRTKKSPPAPGLWDSELFFVLSRADKVSLSRHNSKRNYSFSRRPLCYDHWQIDKESHGQNTQHYKVNSQYYKGLQRSPGIESLPQHSESSHFNPFSRGELSGSLGSDYTCQDTQTLLSLFPSNVSSFNLQPVCSSHTLWSQD